ncbi:MAG: hypothetical protein AAFY59_05410 [Pseudomonadota bacterium]
MLLRAKGAEAEARLEALVSRAVSEGSPLRARTDMATGCLVLMGESEEALDRALDPLVGALGEMLEIGAPTAVLRETVTSDATASCCYDGPHGRASVDVSIAPKHSSTSNALDLGGFLDASPEICRALRAGAESVLDTGDRFPPVGVHLRLLEIGDASDATSPLAIEIAARMAVLRALREARPLTVWPVMAVRIFAAEGVSVAVLRDLAGKRGRNIGRRKEEGQFSLSAEVPLALLFGYRNTLLGLSGGQGWFEMRPSHYEPLPGEAPPAAPLPVALVGA